jgi:AraC-like DNA-binding protein
MEETNHDAPAIIRSLPILEDLGISLFSSQRPVDRRAEFSMVRVQAEQANSFSTPVGHHALIFCFSGVVTRHEKQRCFQINPNTVALSGPVSQGGFHSPSADLDLYIILSKKSLLQKGRLREPLIDRLLDFGTLEPMYIESSEQILTIRRLFWRFYKEYSQPLVFHDEKLQLIFIELVLECARSETDLSTNSALAIPIGRQKQLSENFKKLVNENFLKLRTVQEYADLQFVSAKHLSDVIKQETGKPPLHYIHEKVFEQGKYWLRSSRMPVKEIASALNFDNSSHFSSFFKNYSGYNPTDFRKEFSCSILFPTLHSN